MFDIEVAITDYSGAVRSIILDLTDTEHLREVFSTTSDVIKSIDSIINQVHGFEVDFSDFMSDKFIFGKKRRLSNWRLVFEPTKPSFGASQLYLKLNQPDLDEFVKKPSSRYVGGFLLTFESPEALKAYEEANSFLFASGKYRNVCFVEKFAPFDFKPNSVCQELYVDNSYLMKYGFYRN